jgi:hypothetical protein
MSNLKVEFNYSLWWREKIHTKGMQHYSKVPLTLKIVIVREIEKLKQMKEKILNM